MGESVSSMVADVFREAKDAPTSFEDENWLEGFEYARRAIAERIASRLSCLAMFSETVFLTMCDVLPDDNDRECECANCMWNGVESELNEASQRLDPGGVVPAGECPECGCLAYLKDLDEPKFAPGTEVFIRKVGKTKTVVRSEHQYGHERRYTLRERDGTLDVGWREDELEAAFTDEEKAEQRHISHTDIEWPIEDPAHVPGLNEALAPRES